MGVAAAIAASAVVGGIASNVASNKASSASSRASSTAADLTREGRNQARSDLLDLFPQAQQSANLGFQGALDVFGDVIPQQSNIFQQGNINAQNTLLAGLPQQQNAILGGNVNLGALQSTAAFQPDFGFLNQQTPMNTQAEQERLQAEDQARINALNTAPQQTPVLFGQNSLGGNQGGFNFNTSNLLSGKFNNTP